MLFRVDPSSAVGLADQVAAQVRGALVAGRIGPGDRLPAAREVATGLGVNMHTVLRAFQALRDEGLIELRRGRGAVVRDDIDSTTLALAEHIDAFAEHAIRMGWSADRAADAVREAVRRRAGSPESDESEGNDQA